MNHRKGAAYPGTFVALSAPGEAGMERMQRTARKYAETSAYARPDHADVPAWDVFDVPASTIESLRAEIGALRERLSNAAPKRAVAEMDKAVTLLCRRVDDIRAAGDAREARMEQAVSDELAAIRAGLAGLASPDRFQALEAGLEAMARKIDLVGARAVDPVEVARLQGQLGELQNLVQRAVAGPQSHEALQKLTLRLGACAEDVARAGEETAQRLAQAAGDFERNADTLLARFAEMEARARSGDAEAAEKLRRSLLGALDGVHRRLDQMSGQMADQVASLSPALGAEISQRLGALAQRIAAAEEAGKAAVSPIADAVERHLSRLGEQFRDTHARLGRLDEIETSLNRLAEEMRLVRESARTAATEAASAVASKVSQDPEGTAVVGLKRGLAALEARQDEMERRAAELYANDLEQQLRDVAVALDRERDGTFAPRAAAGPSPSQTPAQAATAAPDMAAQDFAAELAQAYASDFQPAAAPTYEAAAPAHVADAFETQQPLASDPAAMQEIDPHPAADPVADIPWPRPGRRVDWSVRTEGGDARPRVERRVTRPKPRDARPARNGLFASLLGRKRQVAMVALIAGAATVFAGTAVGMAWQNGPEILSGMTNALRRLVAPAVAGVSAAELPAAIGPSALQAAARNGDPSAAFLVAGRYAEGHGTTADLDAATKWLGYAVQRGSALAALRLGALYESAGKDMGEARRFYSWAAEQGNVRAMHALAMLLSEGNLPGLGGKPDWAGAVRWFRAAADLGHRDSQYNLGVIYARGLGVAADVTEAWKWLSLAAAQGDEDSARKRDLLSRDADPAVLARAQQAVAAFVPSTPLAAANVVDVRPEWQDGAPDSVARAPASTKNATRMASSAPAGR